MDWVSESSDLGRNLVIEKVREYQMGLDRMERLLKLIGGGQTKLCPSCFVLHGPESAGHPYTDCCDTDRTSVKFRYSLEFKDQNIKWPDNFIVCWRCGVWSSVCDGASKGHGWEGCEYPDTLLPLAMVALHNPAVEAVVLKETGRLEVKCDRMYGRWLSRKRETSLYGEVVTNAIWVVNKLAIELAR